MESQLATLAELPTTRTVWRIVLIAVAATLALIAVVLGGYSVYHQKATQISHLKGQRQQLRSTNAALSSQLAGIQLRLGKANTKLSNASTKLVVAKKNLTKTGKQLRAANARAVANYDAGYSAGNGSGYSSGYSSGHDAGLTQGSDQLSCSDDPDVYWLPACY